MYQFFVEPTQIDGRLIRIVGEDVNHIKNVLRMREGEEIYAVDASQDKRYLCKIQELLGQSIECEIVSDAVETTELPAQIYLFQGLPKADKMELIIQKATELGIYQIIPVNMKRCVVKLESKKIASKIARWQAIAEAAAKQSKRTIVPKIEEPISYEEAIKRMSTMDIRLLPYECAEGMKKTRELIGQSKAGDKIGIVIGPEGGFDPKEVELAFSKGVEPITLGRRILRTETAGFTTLAYLVYHLEP